MVFIGPGPLEEAILVLAANGAPWTCEAICKALPGRSRQAVARSFRRLAERGFVRLTYRRGRTLKPVLAVVLRQTTPVQARAVTPVQARTVTPRAQLRSFKPLPPPATPVQARTATPVQARAATPVQAPRRAAPEQMPAGMTGADAVAWRLRETIEKQKADATRAGVRTVT